MWQRIYETILRCGGNLVIPGTDLPRLVAVLAPGWRPLTLVARIKVRCPTCETRIKVTVEAPTT